MTDLKPGAEQRKPLSTLSHDRDALGLRYVYPVLSRRAQGVSIGINLNPNNACNWRCVYCQVPNLVRGAAPNIDLALLEFELRSVIDSIEKGSLFDRTSASSEYVIRDFALSGNGEPTSSPQLLEVLELLQRVKSQTSMLSALPIVLITNGSLADRAKVQLALQRLRELGGVVWFKLDSATDEGLRRTNSATTRAARHLERLAIVAQLCPTWIQSCWFCRDGRLPSADETGSFVAAIEHIRHRHIELCGVQLYTIARLPHQPEGSRLSPVPSAWLKEFGEQLQHMGLSVIVAG